MEKYLLRRSFDGLNFLPDEVLWRKKEAFSDGTSSNEDSWFSMIQKYIKEKYNCTEKEYYKQKIQEYYGNKCDNNFVYYWLPNSDWVGQTDDPSARTLAHY
jgi:asparagine synthase (glutamine-hydrolysing)